MNGSDLETLVSTPKGEGSDLSEVKTEVKIVVVRSNSEVIETEFGKWPLHCT